MIIAILHVLIYSQKDFTLGFCYFIQIYNLCIIIASKINYIDKND
jgi:hypothetical protein